MVEESEVLDRVRVFVAAVEVVVLVLGGEVVGLVVEAGWSAG